MAVRQFPPALRTQMQREAFELRMQRVDRRAIAAQLTERHGLTPPLNEKTVGLWLKKATAEAVAKLEAETPGALIAKNLAVSNAVIKDGFRRLERLHDTAQNIPGIQANILKANKDIAHILGLLVEKRDIRATIEQVSDFTIVIDHRDAPEGAPQLAHPGLRVIEAEVLDDDRDEEEA